uniref:Uncharacterized protein n=1 Tax=Anguilla anguilla TaxID=7936 RepID=A0A0E9QS77_ANGAN
MKFFSCLKYTSVAVADVFNYRQVQQTAAQQLKQ